MSIYRDSEQLYMGLKLLFERVHAQDPGVEKTIAGSKLIIRLRMAAPSAEVVLNGRKDPPQIIYGFSSLRPDLDVELKSDVLHAILLDELPLSKAVASGKMKVRGPVWKSFILESIFHSGQAVYPHIVSEMGLDHHGR